jgi:hypothetical protein
MNDFVFVIKTLGYALLVPITIGVLFIVFGKLINIWLEASNLKKDRISLCICLCIILFCIVKIALAVGDKSKQNIFNGIILLALAFHFSAKEIRQQGGYKAKSISGRQSEALSFSISGAWRSRYHWGAVAELIVLIFCIYTQFSD